jgi:hypothetical protein
MDSSNIDGHEHYNIDVRIDEIEAQQTEHLAPYVNF